MSALVILENSALSNAGGEAPPVLHLLAGNPPLVFAVERSRLFAVTPDFFEALVRDDEASRRQILGEETGESAPHFAEELPAPTALSLNIAQACNLSCGYCYAGEGRFGSPAAVMPQTIAHEAVRQLIQNASGPSVSVGFIGGEPFLNREVLWSTVNYAVGEGSTKGVKVRFSVTTNGTLLQAPDIELLREHKFAVSVSLDGGAAVNDAVRKMRRGSSFATTLRGIAPLLHDPGGARIAARATVTRLDLRVAERVEELIASGFSEVGVSPVRSSPDPLLVLRDSDWSAFLDEMIRAAEAQRIRLRRGKHPVFSNLATALKQLHAGYCKPLPCGSSANYVSLSARGDYFTCHRTVGNPRFNLGSLATGLSKMEREAFVRRRHVDLQEPCRSCWARYLCGGGCHAEVLTAGRNGCDSIRGWLEYCLRLYDEMLPYTTTWLEGAAPA